MISFVGLCSHSSTLISGCCSRSEALGVLVCRFTFECLGSSSSSKLLNSEILCTHPDTLHYECYLYVDSRSGMQFLYCLFFPFAAFLGWSNEQIMLASFLYQNTNQVSMSVILPCNICDRGKRTDLSQIKHKDLRMFLLCFVNTQEVQLLHHCSRYQGLKGWWEEETFNDLHSDSFVNKAAINKGFLSHTARLCVCEDL